MKAFGNLLKTTLIGGFFVLMPILLSVLLLDEAISMLIGLATPLADLFLPGTSDNVRYPVLLAVILLTVVSFLLGLLLQASPGRRLFSWAEQNTLGRLPAYNMLKVLTTALIQTDTAAFRPAMLVQENRTREPAYLVEDHDDGYCTVLLPAAPTPFVGPLKVVPRDMVELLDVNLADFSQSISHLGVGLCTSLKQRGRQ